MILRLAVRFGYEATDQSLLLLLVPPEPGPPPNLGPDVQGDGYAPTISQRHVAQRLRSAQFAQDDNQPARNLLVDELPLLNVAVEERPDGNHEAILQREVISSRIEWRIAQDENQLSNTALLQVLLPPELNGVVQDVPDGVIQAQQAQAETHSAQFLAGIVQDINQPGLELYLSVELPLLGVAVDEQPDGSAEARSAYGPLLQLSWRSSQDENQPSLNLLLPHNLPLLEVAVEEQPTGNPEARLPHRLLPQLAWRSAQNENQPSIILLLVHEIPPLAITQTSPDGAEETRLRQLEALLQQIIALLAQDENQLSNTLLVPDIPPGIGPDVQGAPHEVALFRHQRVWETAMLAGMAQIENQPAINLLLIHELPLLGLATDVWPNGNAEAIATAQRAIALSALAAQLAHDPNQIANLLLADIFFKFGPVGLSPPTRVAAVIRLIDTTNYVGVFVFEAVLKTNAAVPAKARLFNKTDGIIVVGSTIETLGLVPTRVRSGALALSGAKEYEAEWGGRAGGGIYTMHSADVVALPV